MHRGDDHNLFVRSRACLVLTGAVLGTVMLAVGCSPQVVRSTPPSAPTSAVEIAQDVDRLDELIERGTMPRRDLIAARDRYQTLVEQLRERPSRDPALQQLALAKAEAAVALYDDLIALSEQPATTRAERADIAEAGYARVRAYLDQLLEIQQGVDMSPALFVPPESAPDAGKALEEKTLPPPPARRLLEAYQKGAHDQVIKEVKGHVERGMETLDTGVLVAYALSLGAVGRIADALEVMDALQDRALIEPMMLEARYRQTLWLLKAGRHDDAARAADRLMEAIEKTGQQIDALSVSTRAIQEDIAQAPPSYLEKSVDVRLAVADGRYTEARTLCSEMLAQEVSRRAVDRVEKLLAFVDAAETQALDLALSDVNEVARTRGRAAARARLAAVASRFPETKYRRRLETAALQYGLTLTESAQGPGRGGEAESEPEVTETRVVSTRAEGAGPAAEAEDMNPSQGQESSGERPEGEADSAGAAGVTVGGAPEGANRDNDLAELVAGIRVDDGQGRTPEPESAGVGTEPPEQLRKTLDRGIALTTAGRYEEAIAAFDALLGTSLEQEALPLRQKAVDQYVQRVRERVAREYVRSSQVRDDTQRLELLIEIYQDLEHAIETYPETTLKAKAEHNLKVIAGEIEKLDPEFEERREETP